MKQPSYSMKRLIDSEGKKQSHPVWRLRGQNEGLSNASEHDSRSAAPHRRVMKNWSPRSAMTSCSWSIWKWPHRGRINP